MGSVAPPRSVTSWWRPLARSDRWALTWFLGVPILLFVIPALFGRPAIDADNLIQNFPLRVLAGRQMASGHWPLLDPLTNAGTPLLGGMNAGAFYPLTLIFTVVPAIAAWLVNMIAVYATAAVGLFALARWHGLSTWPAFTAAVCYTYSGAMIGQMVHIGVVQGYSFLPWAALVMLALAERLGRLSPTTTWRDVVRVALPWAWAVAGLWGLTFLTGEPRAIADMELLAIVVVPCVLGLASSFRLTTWRQRVAYLVTLILGFAWGVGLGLAQLLPGWSFITFSQRSHISYQFFGAGSLAVRWTTLLLSPDVFGGNGTLAQTGFFANYNLTEVTGYAGIVALMAGAAFLSRLTRRGWRGTERDFTIYVVVGVVGLFATWGSFTPVGHLFRAIPVFGSTRLQSRNVILVDLALAMFLGWWFERLGDVRAERAGLGRRSTWLTVSPALAVATLSLALLGWGPWVVRSLGFSAAESSLASDLTLLNLLHLVIACGAVAVVLALSRSGRWITALRAVFVIDLVVFVVFTSTGLIGGSGAREPSRHAAVAQLGTAGRFALVDPSGSHTVAYRALGEPNMNVFTGLSSVQGYGALISTPYDNATGTHPQAMLNPCHLSDGTFRLLRLSAIAISASELSAAAYGTRVPASCVAPRVTPSTRRYFGQLLRVTKVTVRGLGNAVVSSGRVRVRLFDGAGRPVGEAMVGSGGHVTTVSPTHALWAAGFTISAARGVRVGDAVVTASSPRASSFRLDTNFQLAIDSAAWRLASTHGDYSVFRAQSVLPPVWLATAHDGRVSRVRATSWGDTRVTLTVERPTDLVRSEAYLPGWRATATNLASGQVVDLAVVRTGLIQRVRVPRGQWTIDFHYDAPYARIGLIASGLSLTALASVGCALVVERRRRAHGKVHS